MRQYQIKPLRAENGEEDVKAMARELVAAVSSLQDSERLQVLGDNDVPEPSSTQESPGEGGEQQSTAITTSSYSPGEVFREATAIAPVIMGKVSIAARTVRAQFYYFNQESLVLDRSPQFTIFDFDHRFGRDLATDFRLHPAVGAALVALFAPKHPSESPKNRDVSFLLALWKTLVASTLTVHYYSRSTVLRLTSVVDEMGGSVPGLHWVGPLRDAGLHNLFCSKDSCMGYCEEKAFDKNPDDPWLKLFAVEGRIETVEKLVLAKPESVIPILEGMLHRGDARSSERILTIAKTMTAVNWKDVFQQPPWSALTLTEAGTAKNLLAFLNFTKDVGVELSLETLQELAKLSCDSMAETFIAFGAPPSSGFPFPVKQIMEQAGAELTVDHNPTLVKNPVWERVFHLGLAAYELRQALSNLTPEFITLRRFLFSDQIHMDSPLYTDAVFGKAFYSPRRFGATITSLPDGRRVMIAGEHEDFYDPDFFIYGEVVVIPPGCAKWISDVYREGAANSESETEEEVDEEGDDEDDDDDCDGEDADEESHDVDEEEDSMEDAESEEQEESAPDESPSSNPSPNPVEWDPIEAPLLIYRYPSNVFPPTDGHSAVFLPKGHGRRTDQILILGNIGYAPAWPNSNRQAGLTPAYVLDCETWAIESLQTTGGPGWFCNARRETYDDASNTVTLTFSFKCSQLWTAEEEMVKLRGTGILNLHTLTWSLEVESKKRE